MTKSLPQGTVTFFFTDVEGSTRLWEHHPAAMQHALDRHFQILESIAAARGGAVVKSTGDGMLAVFRSASNALRAAIDAQRSLLDEDWPSEIGNLAVRMALHSGAAQLRSGDYYGQAANRAARLLDAGHGGQILLSSTTRSLVQEDLPQYTILLDLGQHRLRDLLRPERIYQLALPGLPRDFPPLNSQPIQLHNLPRQTTPFIGRLREQKDLTHMLRREDVRLLTLTGSGGSGKTRLSLQVAKDLIPEFTDGVFFVDLTSLPDPDLLPSAIAQALDLRLPAGQDIPDVIQTHLSNLETLLILDNLEHLLSDSLAEGLTRDLIMDMLDHAPDLKLLITSRIALNLPGEWQYPLAGLSLPEPGSDGRLVDNDSIRLFDTCARRVRPDFSLTAEGDGVLTICKAVEGIPLAIELAASWVNTLETAEIAAEIHKNIGFLATTQRGIPPRHRSMQAVFAYSMELLDSHERDIFTLLTVFQGGFSREAAADVANASLPILSSLYDKSLLRREGARYYVHGLLRQFTADQLRTEAKNDDLKTAHYQYYASFMANHFDSLLGGQQVDTIAEIKIELENIRTAWIHAVDSTDIDAIYKMAQPLGLYYQMQSQYQEAQSALKLAAGKLDQSKSTGADTLIAMSVILVDLAWITIRFGQLRDAESFISRCQHIYEQLGISPLPGHGTDPRLPSAIIALIKGDYAAAETLGHQAHNIAAENNHPSNLQFAHYILNNAALARGQNETAKQYATHAYTISQELEDRWFMAYCLIELGNVATARDDFPGAAAYYQASLSLREEFGDIEGMAVALMHLGQVALRMDALSEAQHSFERAVEIYEEIYDRGGLASALNQLGRTSVALNDRQKAVELFRRALGIACEIQYKPLILSLLSGIAPLFIDLGRREVGLESLSLVANHPAAEYGTRLQAEKLLADVCGTLSAEEQKAVENGRLGDLDELLPRVRASLVTLTSLETVRKTATPTSMPDTNQTLIEPLTPRELDVLELISQGLTNRQIAGELFISIGTVKSYTSQIYGKLGVGNRTQAVAHARTLGLID